MLIARKPKAAHWYLPDGTPFYEVPNASKPGQLRNVTIRDAFKAGAFRSVTNVLDMVAKPGLVNWQVEQAVLAALTLPRRPDETDQEFAARALADADEQAAAAREMGTRLHDAAANFLTKGDLPFDREESRLLMPFIRWAGVNVKRVIASERVVVNAKFHYAGRLDLAVERVDGSLAIIDLKTQDVKLSAKGEPKPEFYPEWPLQLAAYAACPIDDNVTPAEWSLVSLVLDRARPGLHEHEWSHEENMEDNDHYLWPFLSLCESWTYFKGGTPGKDAKAA